MFVEGEIEVKAKERSVQILDEHEAKIWLQRSFKDMCCYRISSFRREADKSIRAQVALKISALPEMERKQIASRPNDAPLLRAFVERMFDGKGTCRCIGEPKLKQS